MPNMLIW